MIDKKDILKMVHHVSQRAEGKQDKRIIYPEREWLTGMGIFVVIVVVGGVLNALSFQDISHLQSNVTDSDAQVERYQERAVEQALEKYRARRAEYLLLQQNVPVVQPVEAGEDDEEGEQIEEDTDTNTEETANSEDTAGPETEVTDSDSDTNDETIAEEPSEGEEPTPADGVPEPMFN